MYYKGIDRLEKWFEPEEGEIKINVDGSFCEKQSATGVGLICRDESGCFMGEDV